MDEKQRRHQRIQASLLMYVEQTDNQGRMRMNTVGQVLNISEGGILAEMNCPMDLELESAIVVALGADCLELRPRLARMERLTPHRYRVAFQIDHRARKARTRIAEFVQRRLDTLLPEKAA